MFNRPLWKIFQMNRLIKGCILLLLFIDLQGSQTLQSSGVSVLSCNNTPSDNIQIQRRQTILRLNGSIRQERSLRRLERKKYVSNVVRKSRFRSKKKEEEEPSINSPPVSKILGLIIFYSFRIWKQQLIFYHLCQTLRYQGVLCVATVRG